MAPPMADVPFTLKTFGLDVTSGLRAQVAFEPSRQLASGPDGLLVRRVVVPWDEINPTTGVGVADLAPTTRLTPRTFYRVRVELLNPDDGSVSAWATLDAELHVPPEGGSLADLLDAPPPFTGILFGYGPYEPPAGFVYLDLTGPNIVLYGQERQLIP